MTALDIYLNEINGRRGLIGMKPLDPRENFTKVYTEIAVLGSPDILSKDGELSVEETRKRTDLWLDAMAELNENY